jgi:hypothetical protein
MSNIAINELFYELEKSEQKTHKGGFMLKLPFLTNSKGSSRPSTRFLPGYGKPGSGYTESDLYGL